MRIGPDCRYCLPHEGRVDSNGQLLMLSLREER